MKTSNWVCKVGEILIERLQKVLFDKHLNLLWRQGLWNAIRRISMTYYL